MGTVGQLRHREELPYPRIQDAVVNIDQFSVKFKVVVHGKFNVKRAVLRADSDDTRIFSGFWIISSLSTHAVPLVGRSRVVSTRMSVFLPAPLGPKRPNISPLLTSRVTLSTAVTLRFFSRKIFVRWSILIIPAESGRALQTGIGITGFRSGSFPFTAGEVMCSQSVGSFWQEIIPAYHHSGEFLVWV